MKKFIIIVSILLATCLTLLGCGNETKPVGIEIVSQPTTVTYSVNDEVSFDGLAVKIKYDDGSYSDVVNVSNLVISPVDTSTSGTKKVTVRYSVDNTEYEASFEITVEQPHVHTFGDWEVVTPATHLAEGQERRTCACGEQETRAIEKTTEHTFGDWEVVTSATHLVEGQEKRTCACGEQETRAIDKTTEHTFGEWEVVTSATHLVEGQEKRTCACGEQETRVIQKTTEHTFGEWEVVTPATHLAEGQEKRTCACGEQETRAISKTTAHTFGEWETITAATHLAEGQEKRTCACGEQETRAISKTTEHTFGEWEVVIPATHLVEGQEKHTCACGEQETRAIQKTTEHTFGDWEVVKPATHLAEGQEKRTCACGEQETRAIEKTLEHTFGDWEVATAATHLTEGQEKRTCACGEQETRAIQKTTEHTFGEWEVVTSATHLAEGQERRTCACGEQEIRAIEKTTEHTFGEWEVVTPATHLAEGQERRTCACGEQETRAISKTTEHTFGEWEVVTPATHLVEGQEKRTCACGEQETRAIEKTTEHTFGDWEVVTPATHLAEGQERRTCACGEQETRAISKTTEHTFGEWEVATAATHLTEGQEKRTCACGEQETRAISKTTEHTFGEWEVVTPATHLVEGQEKRTCACGEQETRVIEKTTEHTFGEWEVVTPATCTVAGSKERACACGEKETDTIAIDPTAHAYGAWVQTKAPTCSAVGEETRTCTHNAEHIEKRDVDIDPTAHTFGEWEVVTSATCTVAGSKERACACGEKETDTIAIDPTAHAYGAWVQTKAPTCSAVGEETRTCTHNPEHIEKRDIDIDPTAHAYGTDWVSDATYHWHECANCHDQTLKAEHAWTNDECTVCQEVRNTDGLTFELVNNGAEYAVTGYDGESTRIRIISTYNGKPITSIQSSAFRGNAVITSVTLPDNLTSIGDGAFINCIQLASVNLGVDSQLNFVGIYAFDTTLWQSNQPDGLVYLGDVLYEYKGTMPENTSLEIPQGTVGIGACAFVEQLNLISVTLPDSLTNIGASAFEDCENLEDVIIGTNSQISFVNIDAFTNTLWLDSQPDGVVYVGKVAHTFVGTLEESETRILEGTVSISPYAFVNCEYLENVILPDSLISIGENAFSNCEYIEGIYFGENTQLATIGLSAFQGCIDLEYFAPYNAKETFMMPDTLTSIGNIAFAGCERLTNLAFSANSNLTSIGDAAFIGSGIVNINIPDLVTSIGASTFSQCLDLVSVTFSANSKLASIGIYAFYSSGLESISIPDSVTSIGEYAFSECEYLQTVTFGTDSKLTSIDKYTFDTSYIEGIVIPDSVISIGESAFSYCENLEYVTFGENSKLTSIGENAFEYCPDLLEITIPATVNEIGYYAFQDCTSLADVTILADNIKLDCDTFVNSAWFDSQPDGLVYIGKILYAYKGEMPPSGSIEIAEGTVSIAHYLFYQNEDLVSVVIPSSVEIIGTYAFYGCTSLESVVIPLGVNYIGEMAFGECYSLFIYCRAESQPESWHENWNISGLHVHWGFEGTPSPDDRVIVPAVAATCTETGLTEGVRCELCNQIVAEQRPTPTAPHAWNDGVVITAPTCTEKGVKTRTCTDCGETINNDIPASGHRSVTDPAVAATCITTGKTVGSHCSVCNTILVAQTTIAVKGHTSVTDAAVAPTCTATGLTEGSHCSVCRAVLAVQATVAALGHDEVNHDAKSASCTDIGWNAYVTCSRCDYTTYEEISALGHDYADGKCIRCDAVPYFYSRINADGTANESGEYILFGSYPQASVTDTAITDLLNQAAGTLPNSTNNQNWTSYGYYASGNVSNCMWFIDVTHNGQTYRGVYISSYRPYYTTSSSSPDNSKQDDYGFSTSTVYWFRYEPLKWRILSETDGKALLLCEMILDMQAFQNTYSSDTYYNNSEGTPSGIYANNWEYSTIRAWLNDNFYNTAFNALERALIAETMLDNKTTAYNGSDNIYAVCQNNTTDKVFLLSYQDMFNTAYGFSAYGYDHTNRYKWYTDYAVIQGAYLFTGDAGGCYGLRSPNPNYEEGTVYQAGYVVEGVVYSNYSVHATDNGVVPALTINLDTAYVTCVHEWDDASSPEPKTCTKCGIQE